ncbi:MAG: hypothetical protein QM598_12915, partial [Protaetiibacter sp.]
MTAQPDVLSLSNLVGGEWRAGSRGELESRNPADREDLVARVPAMSADDARAAVAAAAAALP